MKFIDGDIISCLSKIASDKSDNVAFQECHVHDGKDLYTWVVGILLMFSCCVISYKDRTSHHLAPTFFLEILLCKSHLTFHNDEFHHFYIVPLIFMFMGQIWHTYIFHRIYSFICYQFIVHFLSHVSPDMDIFPSGNHITCALTYKVSEGSLYIVL